MLSEKERGHMMHESDLLQAETGSSGVSWTSCDEQHFKQGHLHVSLSVFVCVHICACDREKKEALLLPVMLWAIATYNFFI